MQPNDRHRPGAAPSQQAVRAVRESGVDAPFHQPSVDPIQDPVEAAAEQPGQKPASGGEATVGGDEMAAARLLVHLRPLSLSGRYCPAGLGGPERPAASAT
jgi:hypothetical protein